MILGIDTSCYTTSVAVCENGKILADERMVLDTPMGQCGLRQSDAMFMHTKNLAEIFDRLTVDISQVSRVVVSERPRDLEDSYMPVFLSGMTVAKAVAKATNSQYMGVSHQQGHMMAGLYGADCMEIAKEPFLALHLSGGTTEIILVDGEKMEIVGKTLDISFGQLVDRIGVHLGLKFPCGNEMDRLAQGYTEEIAISHNIKSLEFNLSGFENKFKQMKNTDENIAYALFLLLADILSVVIEKAKNKYNVKNVLLVGGVCANSVIRKRLENVYFTSPKLSSDNAVGVALLGENYGSYNNSFTTE